jgi:hypothetical protein
MPIDASNMWTTGHRANRASAAKPTGSDPKMAQLHFLTICWEGTGEDGAPIMLQATLCKTHRQVIALQSSSARGVRRQFGESCDMCDGREPRALGGEAQVGQ